MLKKSRKLLSILLAAILLFSAFAPMALAADEEKYPVIYISGYGSSLYKEKGNVMCGEDITDTVDTIEVHMKY